MPLWFDWESDKDIEKYSEVEELEDGIYLEHMGGRIEQEIRMQAGMQPDQRPAQEYGLLPEYALELQEDQPNEVQENPECNMFLFGDPETDREYWHEQSELNSSPITCQRMIVEQVFQREFSEYEIMDCAKKKGYYSSESGIAANDIDKLFQEYGLGAELDFDVSVTELAGMLDQNEKIICLVNDFVLSCPEAADLCGISPNHAVQVIGMDLTDPQQGKVIVNDPGEKKGRGVYYDLNRFLKSWRTGGCMTVSVHGRYGDDNTRY